MANTGAIRLARSAGLIMAMLFMLVLLATMSSTVKGGPMDGYEAKAAFLFNFARFVDWPAETFHTINDPITICILGPNPFGDLLKETISEKRVAGRRLTTRQLGSKEAASGCQILFVNAAQRKRFQALLPATKGKGVLTVGEDDSFTGDGGVIDFKRERGRLRLEINVAAAEFEQLHISSKLLSMAQVVRQIP